MKAIRVTFRAVFRQPIGILNPGGWAMNVTVPVEVFGHGDKWQVRNLENGKVFGPIGTSPGPDHAKTATALCFKDQIEPWQMWGTVAGDGQSALSKERMLDPDEVAILPDNKFGLYGPEDRTHICPVGEYKSKMTAVCGAVVPGGSIISVHANKAPSCTQCAEIYAREYASK